MERELTPLERGILDFMLGHLDLPAGDALRAQVPHVRVLDGILSGPTFLELAVSPVAARADCPDGKVPVDAVIWSASGETTGFILVWTHGGYLVTLERTWVTDEMPEGFPALEQLRLWDPKTNRIWDPRSV